MVMGLLHCLWAAVLRVLTVLSASVWLSKRPVKLLSEHWCFAGRSNVICTLGLQAALGGKWGTLGTHMCPV